MAVFHNVSSSESRVNAGKVLFKVYPDAIQKQLSIISLIKSTEVTTFPSHA